MKKYLIYIIFVVSVLFALETTNNIAYAADTPHTFSLRAYNCNKLNASLRCVDDNDAVISNPPQLTSGSQIEAGKMIKLELYYVPGLPRTISMQIGITYDPNQVEPFYRNGSFYAAVNRKTTDDGGIWPPSLMATPDDSYTDWTVQSNDYTAGHMLRFLVKDPTQETFLETSGVIATMYVKVKEDATVGDIINLNIDNSYTKVSTIDATYAPKSVSGINLEVYKEADADTTLSDLTVTSGSTNYLTNFSNDTKTYTVYVPNNVSSVTVTGNPTKGTTNAVTVPSGSQTLTVSTTKQFVVTTTAESGDTDTYTVNVYRLNNVATLSSLALSNADIGTFSSGTTNYTASVPYATDKTNITATATDSANATVTGTGNNKSLNVGETVFNIVVSPENCKSQYSSVPGNTCTTKTYKVTVTRANPDTNAYLSDLKVNGQTVPNFSKTTYEYTIPDVSNSTVSVPVVATREVTTSTLSGDTTSKSLSVGNNQVKVTVTAQDGTTKHTYTVNVKRKSNVAELSSLTVTSSPQGTLTPSTFSPSTKTYTYNVGPDVTSVSIAATAGNGATVSGTGNYNPQTTNKAEIIVTPEDGSPVTYTVNLTRDKSTDVRLSELSVAGYTISPSYSDSTNSYTVYVPSNVSSVNVTATPVHAKTNASVSGNTNLQTGNNSVIVTVTPEAGATAKRTITINVKKLDNNANLSSLSLTNVNIGTFSSGTTSYTATVPYATDKTKITAGLSSSGATKAITLNGSSISENTNVDLNVGENTFNVTVSPECAKSTYSSVPGNSGTACQSKTYTVVVTRGEASNVAHLTDLTINGATVSGFDKDTDTYNVTVGSNVSSITIGATPNENSALSTNSDIGSKSLNVGTNEFEIVVIAQDGSTRKPYQLNVKKLRSDNELTGLTISSNPAGTQNPSSFNKQTTSYTYTVGPDVTAVTVNATAPTGATLTYSPTATNNIYNPNNVSAVTITVNPESCKNEYSGIENNTCTPKTYTVNLARTESSINTLSGISVNGTPVDGFDPDTTTYTVTVPYDTPTTTVTATPADGDRESVTVTPPTNYGVGDNVYTIAVEAEDGTPNTYTVTVHRKNNDATLSSLSLDNVTFNEDFDPNVTEYTATVPYTTNVTAVNATATDTSLTPVITGNTSLSVGNSNIFTITVTPEDDTEPSKTYTVTVTRTAASSEAYLTDLTIDNVTVEGFDKDTYTYNVSVPNSSGSVVIGATPNEYSTVTEGVGTKSLNVGDNNFTITVIPQSGNANEAVKYYLNIRRLSADNKLTGLTITSSEGSMDPSSFNPNTDTYTYTAGPDVTEVTVTATAPTGAQISYSPERENNIYNPQEQNDSIITITVTPEDRTAPTKTYTINLGRESSSINTLSDIKVNNNSIEGFDPDNTTYTVDVDSSTTTATVTATATDGDRSNVNVEGPATLEDGDNTYTITVTPEDPNAEAGTYTVTVHKKSSDNTLSALSLENVTFNETFEPSVRTYTATVPYTTESTSVTATPNHPDATREISGNTSLEVGDGNVFTITVTPEDTNAEKGIYTVTVTREPISTTAFLTSLTVNGESVPQFDKDTTSYTVDVSNATDEAIIAATPNEYSTVTGDVGTKSLTVGDNEFEVVAVAQDGEARKPYTVTIHRKDNNNKLGSLVIAADPAGSLDTPFDPDTTEYTYTVGPDTPAITVTGTPAGNATVSGDGTFDPTETDKIEVVVTPEDGTPQTYTINVVRNKSTNKDLLSLGVEGYTISPTFDKDTILYTLTVPNNVTKVKVIGEKGDSRQTITGLGEKSVNVGDNVLQVVVTPEDTTIEPKTYTIKVTRLANDNNYLSSLSVQGFSLKESFDKEVQSYTLEVPEATTKINVSASPEVTTSSVSGTGNWDLTDTTTEVKVTVTSQKGTPRDYVITVTKSDDAEYITSEIYGHTIADGMIKTVIYKSKPNELKDQLDNDNEKLHIYATNESTEEVSNDLVLATGYIVKLIKNDSLKDSKIIVIKGDVDGNGKVTLFDAVKVLNHFLEKETLTGANFEAADMDSNGSITLFDAVGVLRVFLADND